MEPKEPSEAAEAKAPPRLLKVPAERDALALAERTGEGSDYRGGGGVRTDCAESGLRLRRCRRVQAAARARSERNNGSGEIVG